MLTVVLPRVNVDKKGHEKFQSFCNLTKLFHNWKY